MTSVGFIGIGNMGLGMAQRILTAGHDLRVYNRTHSKSIELERAGARHCLTPREACVGAEAVIAMTTDDTSSRAVWLGPHGVLVAQLAPRALAVECSTLSHGWVLELDRLGVGAVADPQIVAGGEQSLGHAEAHVSKSDEGDRGHVCVSL